MPPASDCGCDLLVLGLGNLLCSDDGAGVLAAQRLQAAYRWPPGVRVLDGGTLGLSLLPHLRAAREALLLDAVLADAPPGTLLRLEGDEVEPAVARHLSVHQVGVADLLSALRLLGDGPRRITLLGVVPQTTALGLEPSPPVDNALPGLIALALAEVRARGHRVQVAS